MSNPPGAPCQPSSPSHAVGPLCVPFEEIFPIIAPVLALKTST